MTAREFRANTGRMRRDLDRDEEVVLTANGRPFAIVSAVRSEWFDRELRAIRGARAKVALERARESAARAGTADMPMAAIDAIIAGNKKHFPQKVAGKVRIATPREFLNLLCAV
jgi:antitoxin (DNA-binding transcriptional repressor) of toxin-antitoxin stability system